METKPKSVQPARILAVQVEDAAKLCMAGTGFGCAVSIRALEEFFIIDPRLRGSGAGCWQLGALKCSRAAVAFG